MKLSAFLLLGAMLATGLASCNKRTRGTDADACPQDIICTADARMIGLQIKDNSGQPVVLDDFKTVRSRDGKVMSRYESSSWVDTERARGRYTVLGDGPASTERNGLAFTFIGYKGGSEIVRERFIIGHDCCHIRLIEGPEEITVSEQ